MVPLVKEAVLGTVKVSQDKNRLEVCVVFVCKLLDTISGNTHIGVDVLQGDGSGKDRKGIFFLKKKKRACARAHTIIFISQVMVIAAIRREENKLINMGLEEVISHVVLNSVI